MFGRSLASLLGFLAGALVALSGLIGLALGSSGGRGLSGLASTGAALLLALGTIVLGLIIIVVARPRLFWWGGRTITTGFTLIVLGLIVWFILGGGLLVALGAALAILSGVIFLVETRPSRSWF